MTVLTVNLLLKQVTTDLQSYVDKIKLAIWKWCLVLFACLSFREFVSVHTSSRWWVLIINSIPHASLWYHGKLLVWSSSGLQIYQQSSCGISHTYYPPSPSHVIGLLYRFEHLCFEWTDRLLVWMIDSMAGLINFECRTFKGNSVLC